MRLTRRIQKEEMDMFNPTRPTNDKFVETDYTCKRSAYDRDILNKLGQLEDIEDELGVDLILLGKAIKGVWIKNKSVKEPFHIGSPYICFARNNKRELEMKFCACTIWYCFKDYGKTWALTEEELK